MLPLLLLFVGCSKTPEPAQIADFISATPGELEPACVETNDGKRFIVEGYVGPSGDVRVSDGIVNLYIGDKVDGAEIVGNSFAAEFKDGKHAKFDVTNQRDKSVGPLRSETEGQLQGVTLLTTTGDATPADRLAVVFDFEVVKHFQTGKITACRNHVVELRKL